jgi:DNA-binding transcriptional regulator YiaG
MVVDIINTVKEEILRLAEKQAAAQVGKARKAVFQYRKQVAELKRIVRQQEREIKYLKRQVQGDEVEPEDELQGVRFSAKSVRSQRKRLGLTCEQYAKLVGVSPLTISNWETGKARPRRAQLLALVAVRNISKRDALARL